MFEKDMKNPIGFVPLPMLLGVVAFLLVGNVFYGSNDIFSGIFSTNSSFAAAPDNKGNLKPSPTSTPSPASITRFYYNSNRSGNNEIYLHDMTTGTDTQLTNDSSYESYWARVSYQGDKILFYRVPRGGRDSDTDKNTLWVMKLDGSAPVMIRNIGDDGWQVQAHAEWSPDGTKIVQAGGSATNPQVYTQTIDSNNILGAPFMVTQRNIISLDPNWSPDGTHIVYITCPVAATCSWPNAEVYIVPATGGTETRVTYNANQDNDPEWSPDGKKIAYEELTSSKLFTQVWNIFTINIDGTSPKNITNDSQNVNTMPNWSKDGSTFIFQRATKATSRFGIYTMPSTGGNITQILLDPAPYDNSYPSL